MTENIREDSSWFHKVPKVELHLHLEGAIPHETLWELIQKYGGDSSLKNLQALREKFQYRDFLHFLSTWSWKNQFLREYEDFTFIAEAVARDLADQNVLYAEVIFAPSDFHGFGLDARELAKAIRSGISKVPEIEIELITDLVRNRSSEDAARTLDEINEVKEAGITGITIGGPENGYPPEPFKEVYEKARRLGFHTGAHAGEAAGPESIWGAINSLKVERIGHGTRAVEDEELVGYIAEHAIPLEICLLSNVKTRVVGSVEEHPVRKYFDKGIPISINTDDPKMFGNSLAEEYEILETVFGFTRDEIRGVILQGVETSWLPPDKKKSLTEKIQSNPCWQ